MNHTTRSRCTRGDLLQRRNIPRALVDTAHGPSAARVVFIDLPARNPGLA